MLCDVPCFFFLQGNLSFSFKVDMTQFFDEVQQRGENALFMQEEMRRNELNVLLGRLDELLRLAETYGTPHDREQQLTIGKGIELLCDDL